MKAFYRHSFMHFRCETRAHAHITLLLGQFVWTLCTCVRAGSTKEIINTLYNFHVVQKVNKSKERVTRIFHIFHFTFFVRTHFSSASLSVIQSYTCLHHIHRSTLPLSINCFVSFFTQIRFVRHFVRLPQRFHSFHFGKHTQCFTYVHFCIYSYICI